MFYAKKVIFNYCHMNDQFVENVFIHLIPVCENQMLSALPAKKEIRSKEMYQLIIKLCGHKQKNLS